MHFNQETRSVLLAAALAAMSTHATAGARYDFGDNQYVTFGFGTRYT